MAVHLQGQHDNSDGHMLATHSLTVAAGGTDQIKVGYNAAAEGPFTKIITVTYNGNTTKQIRIKGTVWKAPAGSAPANTSVTFLKNQMQ